LFPGLNRFLTPFPTPLSKGQRSRHLVPLADRAHPISWAITILQWRGYHSWSRDIRRGNERGTTAIPLEEAASNPRPGTARGLAHGRRYVAEGLQGALRTLDGRHGRGDDLGRNRGRVQGSLAGRAERGRRTVANAAYAPGLPPPPVEPILRVSPRRAPGT
jgi:hypothetical protein